jgi:hypothetical protein
MTGRVKAPCRERSARSVRLAILWSLERTWFAEQEKAWETAAPLPMPNSTPDLD